MTPEGKVKAAIKKILKARGIWYYMPVQNGMGVVGIPDFICCWDGWFVGIEAKAPGKIMNLTPNQIMRLDEIEAARGLALVIDSGEMLTARLDALERMKQEARNGGEEESESEVEEPEREAQLP